MKPHLWPLAVLIIHALGSAAIAQHATRVPWHVHAHWHGPWTQEMPGRPPAPERSPVFVSKIEAKVRIDGAVAVTTLTYSMENSGRRPEESVLLVPVPPEATVKGFQLIGTNTESKAELLPREEARRIYDETVRRLIDPGLLEFAGLGMIRSSVFPVPPGQSTRAQLTYEQVLRSESGRFEFILPRSENPENRTAWVIDLQWKMDAGAPVVYCPSHEVVTKKVGEKETTVHIEGKLQPGSFRANAQAPGIDGLAMGVVAYPPQGNEDGYFLLVLAPPQGHVTDAMPRELTLVLDRSGSMAGEKLDLVKSAASQIMEGLDERDKFNLIAYNEAVKPFADSPRIKDQTHILAARSFIKSIKPSGGTNIHDALGEALGQPATAGHLPVVLFLTDGLPTVSETSEKVIRETMKERNRDKRRIFTIGVGMDVNTPLLARLADDSRATATFLLPGEDLEMKMLSVFRRLTGPMIRDPKLTSLDAEGKESSGRITDVVPHVLPDLFSHETRLVTGRWNGKDPIVLSVQGMGSKGMARTTATLDPSAASTAHAHIPRLWATRRIAILTEALRDLGVDGRAVGREDPRARELIDEIVKLSIAHGILSEYTAFLARDGQVYQGEPVNRSATWENIQARALPMRSGAASMNQEYNAARAKDAGSVDKSNRYLDSNLKEAEAGGVQQMADRTFFKNAGNWTDSRVQPNMPGRTIAIGSPEFDQLVDRLVAQNRQSMLSLPGQLVIEDGGVAWTITTARN